MAPPTARWYQHRLGTRHDEPARRLLERLRRVPLAIALGLKPVAVVD